jgi:hypothetical protein
VSEHPPQERGGAASDGIVPVGPGHPSSFNPQRLDFGHYAGYSIQELASVDPDYLHWLARHPSGARYRSEISRALGIGLRSTEY